MELPRVRIYEGPPFRVFAGMSYESLVDFDYCAADVSPLDVLPHNYGEQGINWDIVPYEVDASLFDVVVYPDGQEYYASHQGVWFTS